MTPVMAYDAAYQKFEEGKPVLEALEHMDLIGTDLIGSTKRVSYHSHPEERGGKKCC